MSARSRILAIDDTPVNLMLLAKALEPEHDVEVFPSLEAAMPALLAAPVEVILLDIMMPDIDGFTAFERIRALPHHALTPIIFVTASDDRTSEQRGLALGAADFIFKPVRIDLVRMRIRNVLSLMRLSSELRRSEERLRYVMEATGEGVWDWSVSSDTVVHNRAWCEMLGLDESALEHNLEFYAELIHPEDFANVQKAIYDCLNGLGDYKQEYRIRHADGHYLWVEDRGRVVERDASQQARRMVGSIKDIDKRKADEERIHQLAFFDPLTELPNRRLFMDRLEQAIFKLHRSGGQGALMFLDMDRFKELNDTHGHAAGDLLLIQVGKRLRQAVRRQDTVARLGGDEFVILVEGLLGKGEESLAAARRVSENVLECLNQPYDLGFIRYTSTPSIGLALFDGNCQTVDDVLARADRAMYQAKVEGRNRICCAPI